MKILEVLIEYGTYSLNRPFSYLYDGNKGVLSGMRVLLSFNKKEIVGYVLNVQDTFKTKEELEQESGYSLSFIIDVLDETPLLNEELLKLSDEISNYYLSPKISVLQTMLPPSLSPKHTSLKAPKIAYEQYLRCINDDEEGLTAKQIEILRLIKSVDKVLKKEINSPSIIKKLLELERIEIVYEEKRRLTLPDYDQEEFHELTLEQQAVVDEFFNSEDLIYLLQGVTGSGKSEVYLHIAKKMLADNKKVLMLVPEISLTPMMVEYFLRRFGKNIAVLHSELTPAEKYDEYRKIARGEVQVVIGARSAIFAPLDNIGLIIIDEEHVESYKQDNTPCYHARDVAIMRARHHNAKLLLGSATPSLESRARADKHLYHFLKLPHRINDKGLPKTTIINLLDYHNIDRESYIFSHTLRKSIQGVLDRKEQAILLINRRGFSTNVSCRKCGHVFKCPTCHIPLTYHKGDNMLKCHHCGYVELCPDKCPECGSPYLMKAGFGTEKIEKEIERLFTEARTLRLDSDVARIRKKIPEIIERFANKEADILIGTQMIAKGHNFPDVTLVGIVLADIGLNMPSFRASERVFQLITQAVGRSGRLDKKGEAIIQTYSPSHYAVILGAKQDYDQFYIKEMGMRKIQKYPPYIYLASLTISGKNEETVISASYAICDDLNEKLGEDVTILGPISPYIPYENDNYKRVALLKYVNQKKINETLTNIINVLSSKSSVKISINIDPYDF